MTERRGKYPKAPVTQPDPQLRDWYLQEVIAKRGVCCEICEIPLIAKVRPNADHCHFTGKGRGVLCGSCNTGLGMFKDSPDRLLKAALYIEKYCFHEEAEARDLLPFEESA